MRVVVDINHPAQVHFFKNFIAEMGRRGHEVLVTASDKDNSLVLLDNLGIRYVNLGSYGKTLLNKLLNLPLIDIKMYGRVKKFRPDIFLGSGSIRAPHVAFALRKKSINFEDTEHSTEQIKLYSPFVSTICTPECFKLDLGPKQVRYNGYKELAYLHPKYFHPDPAVLGEAGLGPGDKFVMLRFVSWNASHDIGQVGITNKLDYIQKLEKHAKVFISSEGKLDNKLDRYRIHISPGKFQDLLYYSCLYIGEGGTTATESALLGTPSIFVSSLAGTMGNFIELEEKYGLLFNYKNPDKALAKAVELIQEPNLKEEWRSKRDRLLNDKIDVNSFMVWLVENYPESLLEIKGT